MSHAAEIDSSIMQYFRTWLSPITSSSKKTGKIDLAIAIMLRHSVNSYVMSFVSASRY